MFIWVALLLTVRNFIKLTGDTHLRRYLTLWAVGDGGRLVLSELVFKGSIDARLHQAIAPQGLPVIPTSSLDRHRIFAPNTMPHHNQLCLLGILGQRRCNIGANRI